MGIRKREEKENCMNEKNEMTARSGSSRVVEECQACDGRNLERIVFLGYMPPVNEFHLIGQRPREQPSYPAEVLYCNDCKLVQLGLIVDAKVLFPKEYPYTSSTTKILRENFADLYRECSGIVEIGKNDLVVDIGSNDGNLLSNFQGKHRVLGITPEEIGKIAVGRGIETIFDYFGKRACEKVLKENGKARIVTATNVFAHIDNVNQVVMDILSILDENGVFISESHYLLPLVETMQWDTIYHEHLRYYSLHSLRNLLERHGLEVFHVKRIPTHGGSIRVYASRKGKFKVRDSVGTVLEEERGKLSREKLLEFGRRVTESKLELSALLDKARKEGRIFGISAPSRASTLINYTGINEGILECVVEIKGSHKIGKYIPGTLIPVEEESRLYKERPEYALMLSWHISEELIPKLREKGFKGRFIIPLPKPRII